MTITARTLGAVQALLPAGVRGADLGRVATSGRGAVELAGDILRAGHGDVTGELFALGKGSARDALVARLQAGHSVRLLADPETIGSGGLRKLAAQGADLEPWGGSALRRGEYVRDRNPRKVHAKLLHTPAASWLSTAAPTRHKVDTVDVAVELLGSSRDAARAMTTAALAGDEVGVAAAALEAARSGVLLNDAALGIGHLTRTMEQLVGGSTRELLVATKTLDDVPMATMIGAAQRRGVQVTLVTHDAIKPGSPVHRALDGVAAVVDPALHGNVLVADGIVGVAGTAHATPRALGRPSVARLSHELGVVTHEPAAVARLRELVASSAATG